MALCLQFAARSALWSRSVTRRWSAWAIQCRAGAVGAYDSAAWHVDRLHPSELGHRLLAAACTAAMAEAGWLVPAPISPHCAGSRTVTTAEHVGRLVVAGIPWLIRRGQDLFVYVLAVLWRARRGNRSAGAADPAGELGVQTKRQSARVQCCQHSIDRSRPGELLRALPAAARCFSRRGCILGVCGTCRRIVATASGRGSDSSFVCHLALTRESSGNLRFRIDEPTFRCGWRGSSPVTKTVEFVTQPVLAALRGVCVHPVLQ